MQLAQFDIDILANLCRGNTPHVDSAHRLRLELAGLVVDGKDGLRITPRGEIAARVSVEVGEKELDPPRTPDRVDSMGRRLPSQRTRVLW